MRVVKQSEMFDRTYSINLRSTEYSKEFLYYPLEIKLDRCAGCCNTFNGLSNKLRALRKTEN